MITSTIALFAALTLVGPTYKVSSGRHGIDPKSYHFYKKPTSEFHSKLIDLGVDIYKFNIYWGQAGWTNLTVISSNKKEHFSRSHHVQSSVWNAIESISSEVEWQIHEIDMQWKKSNGLTSEEYSNLLIQYGKDHMYIYESLRYQADLLMGLECLDESIPPWSGTPEEQAARDELFTIIETWCPSFRRKEWKRD